jgi:hypothetical protein
VAGVEGAIAQMIESRYWKEDLLSHAKRLKPITKPPRWTERVVVNFEKELVLSFLIVRRLFETHKVSSKSRDYRVTIYACPVDVAKTTNRNYAYIDEVYKLKDEKEVIKDIRFVANQFIHSGAMYAYRETDRNWGGVYLCSDFERAKMLYRIPLSTIREIFILVGSDYPSSYSLTYNERKDDYDIETD